MKRFLIVLLFALPLFAQRDFLTDSEVEKIRLTQIPIERVRLYLSFARQRIDQLQSDLKKDKPGRSADMRELLTQYTSIIEAIDSVSDDALARKVDFSLGPATIANGEKPLMEQLQKVEESAPHDLDRYDLELKEAIATTSDSLDLASEDLGERGSDVRAKEAAEQKQVQEINKAESKTGAAVAPSASEKPQPTRKPPTIYRPGEKKPDDQ